MSMPKTAAVVIAMLLTASAALAQTPNYTLHIDNRTGTTLEIEGEGVTTNTDGVTIPSLSVSGKKAETGGLPVGGYRVTVKAGGKTLPGSLYIDRNIRLVVRFDRKGDLEVVPIEAD